MRAVIGFSSSTTARCAASRQKITLSFLSFSLEGQFCLTAPVTPPNLHHDVTRYMTQPKDASLQHRWDRKWQENNRKKETKKTKNKMTFESWAAPELLLQMKCWAFGTGPVGIVQIIIKLGEINQTLDRTVALLKRNKPPETLSGSGRVVSIR